MSFDSESPFAVLQWTHQQFCPCIDSADLDVLGLVLHGVFGLLVDLLWGEGFRFSARFS